MSIFRPVSDVMTTTVLTVGPLTTVRYASSLVAEHGIDYLFVLEKRRLVGIVSSDDLAAAVADGSVGDCMRSPVPCIPADTTVMEAACIMEERQVACLPVVSGTLIVGVVTADLLLRLVREAKEARSAPSQLN